MSDTDLFNPFADTSDEGFDRYLAAMATTSTEPDDDDPTDPAPEDSWGWEGDPTRCPRCGTSYSQIDVFRRADGLYDVLWTAGCFGGDSLTGVDVAAVRDVLDRWRDVAGTWVEETLAEIAKREFDAPSAR